MAEIFFELKRYCPVLAGLPEEQARDQYVELENSDEGWGVCGCAPVLNNPSLGPNSGQIRVFDEGYDSYLNTSGPYRLQCSGCKDLPKGFSIKIEKPNDEIQSPAPTTSVK